MKYEILLIDMDGTLLDFRKTEKEAFAATLGFYGIRATRKVKAVYDGINSGLWRRFERGEIDRNALESTRFRRLAETCGFDYDCEDVMRRYTEELSSRPYLLGNAVKVCEKIQKICDMYAVTNGFKEVQTGRLGKTPLCGLFKDVFISEEIGYNKPSREYFAEVAKRINGFDPEKTLVVGDSLVSDMKGGIDSGLDVCWFNPKNEKNTAGLDITYTIRNLSSLEKILYGSRQ